MQTKLSDFGITSAQLPSNDIPRVPSDAVVHPVIYKFVFNGLPKEHAWKDATYFGQAVRVNLTAEEAMEERRKEHLAAAEKAALDPESATGLRWAMITFGPSSYEVQLVEKREKVPGGVAHEWADAREKDLIAKAGGPLVSYDLDFSEPQTLNLTEGGQGGYEFWLSVLSQNARKWREQKAKVQEYIDTFGSLKDVEVKTVFELRDGTTFKIGRFLDNVRNRKSYVNKVFRDPARMEWLKKNGFDPGSQRKRCARPKGAKNKGPTKHSAAFKEKIEKRFQEFLALWPLLVQPNGHVLATHPVHGSWIYKYANHIRSTGKHVKGNLERIQQLQLAGFKMRPGKSDDEEAQAWADLRHLDN